MAYERPAMVRLAVTCLVLVSACDRSATPPIIDRAPALVALDPPSARGATSPNLVATANGALLTWLEPTEGKAHRLRFARFTGGAWSTATTITEGADLIANWADVPSIAQQQDGVLVASWAEKVPAPAAHAYDVVLARSVDRGATWKRLGSPHHDGTATEHGFVSLVPAAASTLVVWLDGRATVAPAGATMLRAASVAEAIGDEQVVDDRVCDCCSTAAAATAEGAVTVFRDRSEEEVRDPSIARNVKGAWSSRPVHVDGWTIAGCPVNGPAIAASGYDVAVAWYTVAGQRSTVRVAFSSDAGASFDCPIDVDVPHEARSPVGRVDVVRDGADALVSWIAAEREDARLVVRRVSRDGRLGPELEIARVDAGRDSGFPRIENVGDELLVTWTDTRAGVLRAVRIQRAAFK